eukprot:TRINITY_DN11730_c0_g1_i1.p1 TRINITY_DN11730_c0_g1~~TRINITY_DN11730_c0_g1_i1.p1  ORF type:complete len:1010 (+),score=255.47 TRINITY_DN11730_c0_g1_i1:75-3032(+)
MSDRASGGEAPPASTLRAQRLQLQASAGHADDHQHSGMESIQDDDESAQTLGGEEYQMEGGMEDDEYEPSEQEIAEYCEWLGMDPVQDRALMWIAREALKAPLPEHWKICYTDEREVYYFNMRTGESIWDHPMDAYYKALFRQEKAKLEKKRRKMRLYSGSMPIQPLQDFFSDLSANAGPDAASPPQRMWSDLPEALCDPIDFKLFVDPVVLPTSGRTVSKHTIVNNKWRDPFCREYVENRRLIGNVDKRNEVGAWLAAATTDYFRDIAFPAEVTAWAKRQGSPLAPPPQGSDPPGPPPPSCPSFAELRRRLQLILRVMPFLLDKEDEVCLSAQRSVLTFFQVGCRLPARPPPPSTPSPSCGAHAPKARRPSSRAGRLSAEVAAMRTPPPQPRADDSPAADSQTHQQQQRDGTGASGRRGRQAPPTEADVAAPPPGPPPPPPPRPATEGRLATPMGAGAAAAPCDVLPELVSSCGDSAVLLGCLLTMSTSSSVETLLLVLRHCPALRGHSVLRGFAPEVLNVLQLSPADLALVAQSCLRDSAAGGPSSGAEPPACELRTTNTDYLVKLAWSLLIVSCPAGRNVWSQLDWSQALALAALAANSLSLDPGQHSALCRMLRGLDGWPASIKECGADTIRWMIGLALADPCPQNRILLLYDVLVNGGDPAFAAVRRQRAGVLAALFEVAEAKPSEATGAGAQPREQDLTYGSMLAALLVFSDVCRLEEFAPRLHLQLHVAHDLLPRLTRLQWRPRHFEHTLHTITVCVKSNPVAAWQVLGAERVEFLLRELSKKKRNSDDLRLKLEAIEATEKRLAQSHSINNWLVLSAALALRRATQRDRLCVKGTLRAQMARALRRRDEIRCERVANLLVILNTLLQVRLKPKPTRNVRDDRAAAPGDPACRETVHKIGSTQPPAARRPATPSGSARDGVPRRRDAAHIKETVLSGEMPPIPSSGTPIRVHGDSAADTPHSRGGQFVTGGTVTLPPI